MNAPKIVSGVITTPARRVTGACAICLILCFASAFAAQPLPESIMRAYGRYFSSSTCTACHEKIVDQHLQSYHAQSFSDPLFRGQYFKELLPQAGKDPELYDEAKTCIACHSPIDFIVMSGRIFSEDQINPDWSGVGCAFCHTVTGYAGKTPGNGNYISRPTEERVLGPFAEKYDWHHVRSELHTKSEFCAICHNGSNRRGLEIKSTYTEWKNSIYAEKGIQCQDCHMNARGFLTDGKPVYERGFAADPSSVFGLAPDRPRLYTHRFPGAHSKTQILGTGDITLQIETGEQVVSPGDEIKIYVLIDNSRTGHKMPSGSADLRLLWLELEADDGNKITAVPALSRGADRYDVAGKGAFDQDILGGDIPKGVRVYRAILLDQSKRQTLSSYNAAEIIFDNRLNASELRKETYYFKVPENARDKIILKASLHYLPYPSSFSRRFGLPNPEPYEVTSIRKEIPLK